MRASDSYCVPRPIQFGGELVKQTLSAAVLALALCFCLAQKSAAQPGQIYGYTISTVVGNYQFGNGGPAAQALLAFPNKIALDGKGAVYIADATNNMVRKVVAGQITAIAGTGIPGFSGDGKAAIGAQLSGPSGMALDATGNV